MSGIKIVGTGRAVPQARVSNEMMKQYVDTSDEWIKSRTGIGYRYFSKEEKNYELAADAACKAIADAKIPREKIGLCIVSTITGDYVTPSVSCMVQKVLGLATDIPVFDINAACSGFVYGLHVANKMMDEKEEERPYALLIGSEQISRILDMTSRSTCVLFGDGAAAVVLEKTKDNCFYSHVGASGNNEALVCNGIHKPDAYVQMDGKEIFRFAVNKIPEEIEMMLNQSGLKQDEIDYVVCHQANERIIRHAQRKLKLPIEKFYMNIGEYGNTSSASIPIAIDEMNEKKLLKPGVKIICVGFGAGLTWGSALLEF